MKSSSAKIILFLGALLLFACNPIKRVKDGQYLLTENIIKVDSSKISTRKIYDQIYQQPNTELPLINIPLRLYIYNAAKPHPDSIFYKWLNKKPKREQRLINFLSKKQVDKMGQNYINWQKFKIKAGEAPVIVNQDKSENSADRLKAYYWSLGHFNAETSYKIDTLKNKRAAVEYYVTPKQPYYLDSLTSHIKSKVADSIYQKNKKNSLLREGQQFNSKRFEWERNRLTRLFRNSGLYYFDQDYITFNADTINTGHKALIETVISNRETKDKDTTYTLPFKVRHISDVNIFTDFSHIEDLKAVSDSIHYKDFTIFNTDKSYYSPKALTNAIFIKKGSVYKDEDLSLTYDRMSDLRIFQYPDIKFMEDPRDTTNTDLIANIFLKPKKKFGMTYDLDVSHSNIQDFGIRVGASLLIRNVFHGLETLEIGARASIGSSHDASVSTQNRFFNISEIGGDVKLNFPKIILPFNWQRIIPKSMSPFTTLSAGISMQHNIGLDKQNLTGKYTFRWKPEHKKNLLLNLVDLQYVRNLNTNNYFNVYRNSYARLNEIAQDHIDNINPDYFEQDNPILSPSPELIISDGTNGFIRDIKNGDDFGFSKEEKERIHTLVERRDRLTENNLIFGSSFSYTKSTRANIWDEQFTQFRFNVEAMGNSLGLISRLTGMHKSEGSYDIAGVRFSQYVKGEIDLIKHWDLGQKNILAVKGMVGVAIPYGNANSIPFVRSFFAGGSNDNRGWRPYDLGPGSSGGPNEFNEANMKLALNAEFRFNLFGSLNSAIFVDAGNIWNVLDNVTDERSRFSTLADLKKIAVASGIGLRYDFTYFIIRLDLGFKTYNPAYNKQKWFQDYNFAHSVINVGINYPF